MAMFSLNGASKWINRQDKNISLDERKGQVNAWAGKTTPKNVDVSNGLAGSDVSDSFPSKRGCLADESRNKEFMKNFPLIQDISAKTFVSL